MESHANAVPLGDAAGGPPAVLGPLGSVLVRAAAARPVDDGLFGPHSAVWQMHRDRSFPVAGVRSLLLQALHPLAMAGVDRHSTWREDPAARLAATAGYVLTVTYAERAAAERAAARVRAVHEHVRGVDPVTGSPYAAGDPRLLLYVHAAMVDSIVAVMRLYGRPLDAGATDRYVAEMVGFAEIVGVPRAMVPASVTALDAYMEGMRPELQATAAARDAMAVVLDPPGLDPDLAALWHDVGQVAVGTLPEWARTLYGYDVPPAELRDREPVRQLIGVLDIAYESIPGVFDARRRIDARIRAA